MLCRGCCYAVLLATLVSSFAARRAAGDSATAAQAYRKGNQPVTAQADGSILCEAEEFRVTSPGWQAQNWGQNYYAATFANTFLSRKAFLGAPDKGVHATATRQVKVPEAGRYLALVRYEAPYRFSAQFRLRVEQNGQTKLDRLYGARENLKIWAFHNKLAPEVAWNWGAAENLVWEGHEAYVDLEPGLATLTLVAEDQPEPAAKRNVDVVLLTRDERQVKERIEKEGYLPLDGLLTQAGDVYLKLHNESDSAALKLEVPKCTQHSPYWVHMRNNWEEPITLAAEPGQSTDWTEVGSLLDTLNDGQWSTHATSPAPQQPLHYKLEFGVKGSDGQIEPIRTIESRKSELELAYDADTRYSRRIRERAEVLSELVDYLKQHPVPGKLPQRTLVYAHTPESRANDPKYTAARDEFMQLFGLTDAKLDAPLKGSLPAGYVDVRNAKSLDDVVAKWKADGVADKIAVVSLGDEIGLAGPDGDVDEGFRAWLKSQKLEPADVDSEAGGDWAKIRYRGASDAAKTKPALFYQAQRYQHAIGIEKQKQITDKLAAHVPNAGIGANYSPHHGNVYLGQVHMWVNMFRHGGMTMPWAEDYIWQVPVASQQVNFLNLDLFRAGIREQPKSKIHFYVMPHSPGNIPESWRRQFYGDLAHGMQVVNLFEFRPVQLAYTENWVSDPEMYLAVRRGLCELGTFDDIVQDGRVRRGVAGLWCSEAGDIWNDNRPPFGAGKRTLYLAIRHQQLPLDVVTEEDALAGELKAYKALYLADQHVSRSASKSIAEWVAAGGHLLATAGAGMLDESDQPNPVLADLLGVRQRALETPEEASVNFEKQDLPFAKPLDTVTWNRGNQTFQLPAFAALSRTESSGSQVQGAFADGSPAVTIKKTGQGSAMYCGFLPGLTYFQPAIPLRPVDRGNTPDAMAHFIPTNFDPGANALVAAPADSIARPIDCSQPLVESTMIVAPQGIVIPLVNWSSGPVKGLRVTVAGDLPKTSVALASGREVHPSEGDGRHTFVLDLDVADALILR